MMILFFIYIKKLHTHISHIKYIDAIDSHTSTHASACGEI